MKGNKLKKSLNWTTEQVTSGPDSWVTTVSMTVAEDFETVDEANKFGEKTINSLNRMFDRPTGSAGGVNFNVPDTYVQNQFTFDTSSPTIPEDWRGKA